MRELTYKLHDLRRYIDKRKEMSRSLAAIGLLRIVKDRTPQDLVYYYASNVLSGNSYGLREVTVDAKSLPRSPWSTEPLTSREYQDLNALQEMPNGVLKMSKDYLVRCFWKQIRHIMSNVSFSTSVFSNGGTIVRQFPKSVLQTIRSLNVSPTLKLWDARNAIASLHAAVVPSTFTLPDWVKRGSSYPRSLSHTDPNPSMMGYADTNHMRNIMALRNTLDNYLWNPTHCSSIPNDSEKAILLDLLEIFVIMFSEDMSFYNGYIEKQVYEYSISTTRTDAEFTIPPYMARCRFSDNARMLGNISPELATCIDTSSRSCSNGLMPTLGHDGVPADTPVYAQVREYLKQELYITHLKIEFLTDLERKCKDTGEEIVRCIREEEELCEGGSCG